MSICVKRLSFELLLNFCFNTKLQPPLQVSFIQRSQSFTSKEIETKLIYQFEFCEVTFIHLKAFLNYLKTHIEEGRKITSFSGVVTNHSIHFCI